MEENEIIELKKSFYIHEKCLNHDLYSTWSGTKFDSREKGLNRGRPSPLPYCLPALWADLVQKFRITIGHGPVPFVGIFTYTYQQARR